MGFSGEKDQANCCRLVLRCYDLASAIKSLTCLLENFDQQSSSIACHEYVETIHSLYKKIPVPQRFTQIDLPSYISSLRDYRVSIVRALESSSHSSNDLEALHEFREKLSVHIEALRVYDGSDGESPKEFMLY